MQHPSAQVYSPREPPIGTIHGDPMDFNRSDHTCVVEALLRLIQGEDALRDEHGYIRLQSHGNRLGEVPNFPLEEATTFATRLEFKIPIFA